MSAVEHREQYRLFLVQLRLARKKAGLTQVQAAAALGRMQSFVSKCEQGERRVDAVDLENFAKLYRQPFSFFFPGTSVKS